MVEPQPSKLIVWVRFPSPAPNISEVLVCSDVGANDNKKAHIAQW